MATQLYPDFTNDEAQRHLCNTITRLRFEIDIAELPYSNYGKGYYAMKWRMQLWRLKHREAFLVERLEAVRNADRQ